MWTKARTRCKGSYSTPMCTTSRISRWCFLPAISDRKRGHGQTKTPEKSSKPSTGIELCRLGIWRSSSWKKKKVMTEIKINVLPIMFLPSLLAHRFSCLLVGCSLDRCLVIRFLFAFSPRRDVSKELGWPERIRNGKQPNSGEFRLAMLWSIQSLVFLVKNEYSVF